MDSASVSATIPAARESDPFASPFRRSVPRGKLSPASIPRSVMEISSSEPPPRSPATPSGRQKPQRTPFAAISASSRPAIVRTGRPATRSISAMN